MNNHLAPSGMSGEEKVEEQHKRMIEGEKNCEEDL